MLRDVRGRLREKLGRALHEYVTVEVQAQSEAQLAALQQVRADLRTDIRADLEALLRAERHAAVESLEASMRAWERRQRRDVLTVKDQRATASTAAFVHAEMDRATPWFSKDETLAAALKAAPADGLYLEFGVASGGTLRQIAEIAPVGTVFGFDSFQGLPEDWRSAFVAGTFAMDAPPEVPGAELVIGWFHETLPGFLAEHPEPVAFLHLDADLYSSTVTVLEALEDRLRPGTVLLFDEYFNFPGWEEHEHRAWTEFVARTGLTFEYLGFTADDEQLSLRITDVSERRPAAG